MGLEVFEQTEERGGENDVSNPFKQPEGGGGGGGGNICLQSFKKAEREGGYVIERERTRTRKLSERERERERREREERERERERRRGLQSL